MHIPERIEYIIPKANPMHNVPAKRNKRSIALEMHTIPKKKMNIPLKRRICLWSSFFSHEHHQYERNRACRICAAVCNRITAHHVEKSGQTLCNHPPERRGESEKRARKNRLILFEKAPPLSAVFLSPQHPPQSPWKCCWMPSRDRL
jgi:hypothetical protein